MKYAIRVLRSNLQAENLHIFFILEELCIPAHVSIEVIHKKPVRVRLLSLPNTKSASPDLSSIDQYSYRSAARRL